MLGKRREDDQDDKGMEHRYSDGAITLPERLTRLEAADNGAVTAINVLRKDMELENQHLWNEVNAMKLASAKIAWVPGLICALGSGVITLLIHWYMKGH